MKGKSLDGVFWYGSSCTSRTEGFKYYKEAADQGHLASKWWVGWCQYCGYGTEKNEIEGKIKMESVALSGDSYWTIVQSDIFENGWYGFPRDKNQANHYRQLAKKQHISDCSCFTPGEVKI